MAEFFVRRPIVAMVMAIITMLLGLVAMQRLPIAQYPDITPPQVAVSGTYTGASAIDVEESVATPVEQKVNGVEEMIYMRSINSSDGNMNLEVSFEVGTDLDMANVLTQNRVSESMASVPDEVKRLGITVKKKLSFPLLLVTLYSPDNSYDQDFLTNYATLNVVDELARIRGMGQAEVFGGSVTEYAMRIWIQPDKLSTLGLTVPDVISAVSNQNVLTAAGQIGAEPAPPGTDFTYTVKTPGRFETPEQFGEVVVRSNPDGSQVLLRDIARIELGTMGYQIQSRINGQPTAALQIFQLPDANGLEVARQVFATMERLEKRFPRGVAYKIALDTTKPITAGIREIVITLFQAVGLVIVVVWIFLQNTRSTLIPTLTVPVSLVGTFIVFPLLGFSINTLSLLGLVLAIGIVVDDAIVVVESVSSKIEQGMTPKEATVSAMREVSAPIVATSLVLIAVFVPVAAMAGITGLLYQQFAITIAISVAISSFNALTLSPALSALLLRPPQAHDSESKKSLITRFFDRFNHHFDQATVLFMKLTGFFTHSLVRALILLGVILALAATLFRLVPGGFIPEEDQGYLLAAVVLPDAASLQRSNRTVAQLEEIILREPGVESATAIAGYNILSSTFQPNTGMVFIQLKDWEERPEAKDHAREITKRLNIAMQREVIEGQAFAFGPPAIPGLGTGAGFNMMLQDRGGNSPEYLAEQAELFIGQARQRKEIGNAYTLFRPNVPQMLLKVDNAKALKLGVPIADINSSISAFLGGAYINDFNRFGRLYKVYVQSESEYRASTEGIKQFYVRNNIGEVVPLSTLVDASRSSGPEFTNRFNLFRSAEISGLPAPGYSSAQALAALEEIAEQTLPSDMSHAWFNMSYQEKAAEGSGTLVFVMALLLVYLILSAQYESWSLPISVLLSVPIAVFGAIGGLYLARLMSEAYVNNVFAQIGLVMLIGLSAKNAILIVEFAKVEREKGLSAVDAALQAAKARFRPILMTALSFVFGVLPLLVATGAGAEARKVMGMTVFSGMLVATFVGVLLVPALYVLVDRYIARSDRRSQSAE